MNRPAPARIEALKVENFRALRNVELRNITPLTVLVGPNGSGKSTIFDVFGFLSECFDTGLRRAWDRRGRGKELVTRNSEGPMTIEIKYREQKRSPIITYHLSVAEENRLPVIREEWLAWRRGNRGKPFRFLEYKDGEGHAISGEEPDELAGRDNIPLKSPDLLAVNALGQFAQHPRVAALRDFISGWHVSYLSADNARGQPEAGPQKQLSRTGSNLANVIQHLQDDHPESLSRIFDVLRRRIPHIQEIQADPMPDGRLLLQAKDAPFDKTVQARFLSDGTLKMLAYLVLLHDPDPPPFIGIEEPENFLHPRLLPELAEECRHSSARAQILATTHSPFFLNTLRPEEVRVLWRNREGYTQAKCLSEDDRIKDFMDAGAQLGHLWMEGHFGIGDPLNQQYAPAA